MERCAALWYNLYWPLLNLNATLHLCCGSALAQFLTSLLCGVKRRVCVCVDNGQRSWSARLSEREACLWSGFIFVCSKVLIIPVCLQMISFWTLLWLAFSEISCSALSASSSCPGRSRSHLLHPPVFLSVPSGFCPSVLPCSLFLSIFLCVLCLFLSPPHCIVIILYQALRKVLALVVVVLQCCNLSPALLFFTSPGCILTLSAHAKWREGWKKPFVF